MLEVHVQHSKLLLAHHHMAAIYRGSTHTPQITQIEACPETAPKGQVYRECMP